MDKNGQNRGGPRRGSGRKPKNTISFEIVGNQTEQTALPAFMTASQRAGDAALQAAQVYAEISAWLASRHFREYVTDHALQMYSMAVARWIQAEEAVSRTGFLAKHPTTGAPVTSPYVSMTLEYQRQAQSAWWTIYNMIKDATEGKGKVEEPSNSLLDLLRQKKEAT